MAAVERTYTIPIRREWLKAPKYKRAKRAISAIKTFLVRHMKSEDVRIGTSVNLEIWKHGMKCPPGKVKVNVTKDDKGVVFAELFGAKLAAPKKNKPSDVKAKTETVKTIPVKTEAPKPVLVKNEVPKPASKVESKPALKGEVKPVAKEPPKVTPNAKV